MSNEAFTVLANELEAQIPTPPEGVQHAPGSLFGGVAALVAALRSGDFSKVAAAFRDLVNLLVPQTQPAADGGPQTISFQMQKQDALLKNINWERLGSILSRIFLAVLA